MTFELNKARAQKTGDCKNWSPEDCLKDTLEMIQNKTINPEQFIIHWIEHEDEKGIRAYGHNCAGVSYSEHICLLNVSLQKVLDDFIVRS